jgi:hypothetical protein
MDAIDNQIKTAVQNYSKTHPPKSAAQKAKDAKAAKTKSYTQQINAINHSSDVLTQQKSAPEGEVATYTNAMVQYIRAGGNYTDPQYLEYKSYLTAAQKAVGGFKTQLDVNAGKVSTLKYQIKELNDPKPWLFYKAGLGTGAIVKPSGSSGTGPWIYNAPMVSENYFRGIQAEVLEGNYVHPGNYTDAMSAWTIDKKTNKPIAGRGTFQLDRKTNTADAIAHAQKNLNTNAKPDPTLYGFKFLYNPQTVNMSWGAIQQTDPVFESAGLDPYVAATSNLVASYIDFSIILNRIDDMKYLSKDGLIKNYTNTNGADVGYSYIQQFKSPYPHFGTKPGVTQDQELSQIYEKGTMYDLEYLFKTIHGNGAYTNYKSDLMSTVTSDPGWLPVRPVELHLGSKLRYRVRIANLTVNHSIFNARMVPILSTVTISCWRYWDSQGNINVTKAAK